MSLNLHRLLDGVDGEFEGRAGRIDTQVAAAVEPGEPITLTLEATGPGAGTRTISVDLSRSEARLLGGRLIDSTK